VPKITIFWGNFDRLFAPFKRNLSLFLTTRRYSLLTVPLTVNFSRMLLFFKNFRFSSAQTVSSRYQIKHP
jgi:hypothetical protein